jgi:CBS domain containing-hemolysin-like protein
VISKQYRVRGVARRWGLRASASMRGVVAALVLLPAVAQASMFKGETLDMVADAISWVVLVLVPVVGIAVFWLVHILPEKIAEQKRHPQAKAIQVLCLLSLFFGGMLWPIAWLWAYSKPVLYKMAYGTDVDDSHGPPPGVVEPPEGTLPVLTQEAEVPAAARAVKQEG